MKKKFLLLITVIYAMTCVLGLSACGDSKNDDNGPTQKSHTTHTWSATYTQEGDRHYQTCGGCDEKNYANHSFDADGVCVCGKIQPQEEPVWSTDDYDAFVADMREKRNYRYMLTHDGKKDCYLIDGDKVLINDYETYFFKEENVAYRLEYDEPINKYHKTVAEAFDVDTYILADMAAANITDFDFDTETYSVTLGAAAYNMKIVGGEITFTCANGDEKRVDMVGNAGFTLPKSKYIIDETGSEDPEKPPVGSDDPIEQEEKIYTTDSQGQRIYNETLLAQTLVETLNTDVDERKFVFQIAIAVACVDEIKYIAISNGQVEFGAIVQSMFGHVGFTVFAFKEDVLTEANTKDKLKSYLLDKQDITADSKDVIQYTIDTPEHGATVLKAAQNILKKLSVDGVQKDIDTKGTPLSYLADEEVLFAYSVDIPGKTVGYGIGDIMETKLFIVTSSNVRLTVNVFTRWSNTITPLEMIVKGGNRDYLVHKLDEQK